MKTEITELNGMFRGEIIYDAECPMCLKGYQCVGNLFARYGFCWLPMQTPGLAERLQITDDELRTEMKVLPRDGKLLGGIDTWSYMLRCVWWLWPLGVLLLLPGIYQIAGAAYRWVARNRYCLAGACAVPQSGSNPRKKAHYLLGEKNQNVFALLFLIFVVLTGILAWTSRGWIFMWSVAVAMGYAGKCLTLRDAINHGAKPTAFRLAIWFLAWPGVDGRAFFNTRLHPAKPSNTEWLWAISKLTLGLLLTFQLVPVFLATHPLLAGWTAMVGIIFVLHFGAFHLLSVIWRVGGIEAQPIMRAPILSTSLAEFWSVRWNTAFSIPARRLLLTPLTRKFGAIKASLMIFLLSGLLHEVVISLPARGGFGLPTLYFLLQAIGILIQNHKATRRYGLREGWRGWLFTMIFTAAPLYWLFHPPFVRNVILPMLQAIGAT